MYRVYYTYSGASEIYMLPDEHRTRKDAQVVADIMNATGNWMHFFVEIDQYQHKEIK